MEFDKTIEKIKAARRLVSEALEDCTLPQIENNLRNANMELHWALWNLAEFESLFPELDRNPHSGDRA